MTTGSPDQRSGNLPDKPGGQPPAAVPTPPASPTRATALGRTEDTGQQVLAHASGASAQAMVSLARAHDIPVLQDLELSSALRRLPPGTRIPDSVFQALGCTLDFLLRQEETLPTADPEAAP